MTDQPVDFDIVLDKIKSNRRQIPTFYYIGIGTNNYDIDYPIPENRHELPDYILKLNYPYKVLILIDPVTDTPLKNSPHDIIKIDEHSYKITNLDIDIDIYVIKQNIEIDTNADFIYRLIKYGLLSHPDTLMMISTYTGVPIYHMQDNIINMFEAENQIDVRSRFLLDSKYFKDLGCRYDLTNVLNQPIIEDNRFYNVGYLLPDEFNKELYKIYSKTDMISLQKKSYLYYLFEEYIKIYLNDTYCSYRQNCNGASTDNDRQLNREKMLICIKDLMRYIKSFVDIDEFLNILRISNIYHDINKIRNILDNLHLI
jgi:hypothetical protein